MHGIPLRYSFRNLWRRPVRSVLTIFGLTLLVAVIVFLVAFGRSFGRALRMPGDPRTLIVLSKKAQTFEFSSIPASELDQLAAEMEDDVEESPDGDALFSREVYHFVNVRLGDESRARRALVHGIDPFLARSMVVGFRLTAGELPFKGDNGVLVGRAVADKLRVDPARLGLDARVRIRETVYTVVGIFEAPGTIYENWLIAHPDDLRVTLGRRDYSFARMRLSGSVDLPALARRLNLDERYQLRVLPEAEYFADFAEGFSHFQRFAVLLAVILGLGGLLTGMNTMHNAVVGRIREIGVLRVLGFSKGRIVVAFLVESLLLTGLAGLLACALGLLTNGLPVRLPVAATFPVVVDATALLLGLAGALLMGMLGLSYPMWRALRTPAVEAVRAV